MKDTTRSWPAVGTVIVLVFCLIFFPYRYFHRLHDDFTLANMSEEIPFRASWEIPPLSESERAELNRIWDQTFHYIGKGAQSYAFQSADGRYVMKFFKFKHLRENALVKGLPDWPFLKGLKDSHKRKVQRRVDGIFNGYRLAYDLLREDAALLFIHLNKSQHLGKTVVFFDKAGQRVELALDDHVFVLQKTVTTTSRAVSQALDRGDIGQALGILDKILDLFFAEYQKGVYDRDTGLMDNTGFFDHTPVHLDVGKLSEEARMKEAAFALSKLAEVEKRLRSWLKDHYPQYVDPIIERWESRINREFSQQIASGD